MKRRNLRVFLFSALILVSAFAAWSWLRPYSWNPDPAARCTVVGTQVKRDMTNYWVDVHLKMVAAQTHDLMKPVRLRSATGRLLEPADTTLGGDEKTGTTDLWFKFWLETDDVGGPLTLRVNDGELSIRQKSGAPDLGAANVRYFVTNRW